MKDLALSIMSFGLVIFASFWLIFDLDGEMQVVLLTIAAIFCLIALLIDDNRKSKEEE